MRLFWVCLLSLGFCQPVAAAFNWDLTQLGYQADWRETTGSKNRWDVNVHGDSDWLLSNLTGSFYAPQPDSGYSDLDLKLAFPRFDKHLKLHSGYRWNQDYRIYAESLYYGWQPSPNLNLDFDYLWESREAEAAKSSRYQYRLNQAAVSADYQRQPWRFFSALLHANKDYPAGSPYTSDKWQLDEGVDWQCRKDLRLGITYHEVTAYYPWDAKINNDYWRNYYELRSRYNPRPGSEFYGNYRVTHWEKKLQPYQDQQDLKLSWIRRGSDKDRFIARLELADLQFYPNVDYVQPVDPDDDETTDEAEENDFNSRSIAIASWEYQRDIGGLSLAANLFWSYADYRAAAIKDRTACGILFKTKWKLRQWELRTELAPFGASRTPNAYYRLKMIYNIHGK